MIKVKVQNVRFHIGAQIGAEIKGSLDAKNDKCEMFELWGGNTILGLFITHLKGKKLARPHKVQLDTVISTSYDEEDFQHAIGLATNQNVAIMEPAKKKPGRKPKAQEVINV